MNKKRYTRYFYFTKNKPCQKDYDLIINKADELNAFLSYKTNSENNKLEGYFILRGPRAYTDQVCGYFPNFLFTHLTNKHYDQLNNDKEFTRVGDLPFKDITNKLFHDEPGFGWI